MTFRKIDLSSDRGSAPAHSREATDPIAEPLAAVAKALEGMRYGAIHLIVHDGKAVQLEVTERRRFNP
ncbi:YezD family protein [Novosphingobium colocasiae]|uniref:YezD family protein n=1 Tax=Novosphingobium colocasiae TaxID=1256513 RepID=UPI0035B3E321